VAVEHHAVVEDAPLADLQRAVRPGQEQRPM
jgi:hypothetical protein